MKAVLLGTLMTVLVAGITSLLTVTVINRVKGT